MQSVAIMPFPNSSYYPQSVPSSASIPSNCNLIQSQSAVLPLNPNINPMTMQMVELQHGNTPNVFMAGGSFNALSIPAMDQMNDPSSLQQHLDPVQRRKVIKQRIRDQEEAAFQDSISHLTDIEKQEAILMRIQEKQQRKK